MLFSFSTDGLRFNWIGPAVIDAITQGIDNIDAGVAVAAWPTTAPEERQAWLKRHHGFKKKLNSFFTQYRALGEAQRNVVRRALVDQTNLPGVFSNGLPCGVTGNLPDINKAIDALFEYSFGQLGEDDDGGSCVRDRQYEAIYKKLPERICPFCGLLMFRGPKGPRHALDHFLAISMYPFAGADLRNLPPMCDDCNGKFKGKKDVLNDDNKTRRVCADPYAGPVYQVSLAKSVWSGGVTVMGCVLPLWNIEFLGGPQEHAETWDQVFHVRRRYTDDILNVEFLTWLGLFARWVNLNTAIARTPKGISRSLKPYVESVIQQSYADRAFLKAEVFRFLLQTSKAPAYGDEVGNLLLSIADNIR